MKVLTTDPGDGGVNAFASSSAEAEGPAGIDGIVVVDPAGTRIVSGCHLPGSTVSGPKNN